MPHHPLLLLLPVVAVLLAIGLSACSDTEPTAEAPLETAEPWDLVWISDSMGEGVAEAWADRMEQDLGVEVRVHNRTMSDLSLVVARDLVTEQATIQEELADAEIIVAYGNARDASPADTATCQAPSPTPRDPPAFYSSDDLAAYGDALRDIYNVVFELRAGQPTVIRAFDVFNGMLADWRDAGIEPECTATWESQAGALREAADDYGVPLASFYDAFNGEGHDEDPREKGYIHGDGLHASPEGVMVQVDVLHDLGYDTITP